MYDNIILWSRGTASTQLLLLFIAFWWSCGNSCNCICTTLVLRLFIQRLWHLGTYYSTSSFIFRVALKGKHIYLICSKYINTVFFYQHTSCSRRPINRLVTKCIIVILILKSSSCQINVSISKYIPIWSESGMR